MFDKSCSRHNHLLQLQTTTTTTTITITTTITTTPYIFLHFGERSTDINCWRRAPGSWWAPRSWWDIHDSLREIKCAIAKVNIFWWKMLPLPSFRLFSRNCNSQSSGTTTKIHIHSFSKTIAEINCQKLWCTYHTNFACNFVFLKTFGARCNDVLQLMQ